MSSSTWTLCVCVLTCLFSCSVPEDPQVETVQPGEDVLLLCQGPRGADIVFVQWIRPDLESGSVFFFRDDRTYENYQHPYFHGRVKLTDPQMKDGDVSVILENVNIKDTGTYECRVRTKGTRPELISSVQLQVKDSVQQQITVKTGHNVTLQCLDPRGGDIKLLEWTRRDLNVFVWAHGNMSEDDQHESFKNRVELRDSQMKDGNFSVILKNVTVKDTGTYECRVRNSNTQPPPQLITTVTVTVTDSGGGAGHTWDGGDKDGGDKDGGDKDGGDKDGGDEDGRVGLIVSLSVVTLLFVAVVFMIYRKCNRLKKQIHQPPVNKEIDHELQDLTHERETEGGAGRRSRKSPGDPEQVKGLQMMDG